MANEIRYRVNWNIRVPSVRVNFDNQQLGVMNTDRARNLAFENNLDLIEIVPNANPPLCIIADFGKFKYENNLKEKENKKKQKESIQAIKEIRLTPTIEEHDLNTKKKAILKFIEEDKKVQLTMKFTPRELSHKEIGIQKVQEIIEFFKEKIQVEQQPKFEGKRLYCRIAPKVNQKV